MLIAKWVYRPVFAGLLLLFSSVWAGPQWVDLSKAVQMAKSQNKWVFIDFYADWCTYCHQLEKTTLVQPSVLNELKNNFISVKLNTEGNQKILWNGQTYTESEFASLMNVNSLPTLMFFNSHAKPIGYFVSYADTKMFLNILTYISSGARERFVTFEDYLAKP